MPDKQLLGEPRYVSARFAFGVGVEEALIYLSAVIQGDAGVMQYFLLLIFLRYLSRESSPLGVKKCNHLFALLLCRVFSIFLLRTSSRSLHWCLFWCWIVSKVSLKRLDLQKWSVGWILFAALRGDACRQGEEKEDISVLNEGQPFSINTALFFLLNDCFQEYF